METKSLIYLVSSFVLLFSNQARSGDLPSEVQEVLRAHCFRCHGENGTNSGQVNFITDLTQLVGKGKVVPRNLEASPLWQRINSPTRPMPPAGAAVAPLSGEDKNLIRRWIEEGAVASPAEPRSFFTNDAIYAAVLTDLQEATRLGASDAQFYRYFYLTNLYNVGESNEALEGYRSELSKVLNSLSWQPEVYKPVAVDSALTIYRVDLRSLGWQASAWDKILQINPYPLIERSESFYLTTSLTKTRVPVVRADWFVSVATRPPLYYDLLGIPETVRELETRLGINVEQNLKTSQLSAPLVRRAGISQSGVARFNRVIERHESSYRAGYWRSFDFSSSADLRNILTNPLGPQIDGFGIIPGTGENLQFTHDGGEIIFGLPNGLHGYMLVNKDGRRIEAGPTNLVFDRLRGSEIVAGISCMGCHSAGLIRAEDQVVPVVAALDISAAAKQEIRRIYTGQADLDRMFTSDTSRYQGAMQRSVFDQRFGAAMSTRMVDRFQQDLTLSDMATELGLTREELVGRWGQLGRSLAATLAPLRADLGVRRDTFRDHFEAISRAILPQPGASLGLQIPNSTIAGGYHHTCALSDGKVECWGDNGRGQTTVPTLTNPRQLVAGETHSCVVDNQGPRCWGNNRIGNIQQIPTGLGVPKQLVSGREHLCALTSDNRVECWGRSEERQTSVPFLLWPHYVASGAYHSCAIDLAGIKCWGWNSKGQTNVPEGIRNPRQLSLGIEFSCALHDGGVTCWGSNERGQISNKPALTNPSQIWAGHEHICARDSQGVKCWGDNRENQATVPPEATDATEIGGGFWHTCAKSAQSGFFCWGWDDGGKANKSSRSGNYDRHLDLDWSPSRNIVLMAAGSSNTCVVYRPRVTTTKYRFQCWGQDANLLNERAPSYDSPHLTAPLKLIVGNGFACILTSMLYVTCWGNNADVVFRTPIVRAGDLVGGTDYVCALWSEGRITGGPISGVRCWGKNPLVGQILRNMRDGNIKYITANDVEVCAYYGEPSWSLKCVGAMGLRTPPLGTLYRAQLIEERIMWASNSETCAVSEDQNYACWGTSTSGDTFFSRTDILSALRPIDNSTTKIVADWREYSYACILDGVLDRVRCAGISEENMPPLRGVSDISMGDSYVCALDEEGVMCWGRGGNLDACRGPISQGRSKEYCLANW